jgi:hypothetical protein
MTTEEQSTIALALSDRERGLLLAQEMGFLKASVQEIREAQKESQRVIMAELATMKNVCPSGKCEDRGKDVTDLRDKLETQEKEFQSALDEQRETFYKALACNRKDFDDMANDYTEFKSKVNTWGITVSMGLIIGVPVLVWLMDRIIK